MEEWRSVRCHNSDTSEEILGDYFHQSKWDVLRNDILDLVAECSAINNDVISFLKLSYLNRSKKYSLLKSSVVREFGRNVSSMFDVCQKEWRRSLVILAYAFISII